jgi:hypothetical protein
MDSDVVRALLDGKDLIGNDVPLRWKTAQQGAAPWRYARRCVT